MCNKVLTKLFFLWLCCFSSVSLAGVYNYNVIQDAYNTCMAHHSIYGNGPCIDGPPLYEYQLGKFTNSDGDHYTYKVGCPSGQQWIDSACLVVYEPEECVENGQLFEPKTQQCVTECASGSSLDSYCLIAPEASCSPSSADYLGTAGWGDDHRYVCSGESSCGAGESYAFREQDDGSWSGFCVSDESNPPVCPDGFDGVLEIYDNGFACGSLNEEKADPTRNDSSDGDSDGDGVADDTGIAGQLQDIKGLLKDGNNERGNIGQTLKKGFGDLKEAIANIPGGGGSSGDTGAGQTEIVGEDGNAITWSGGAITMEVQDGLNELNAVQGEYESLIANIRSEMSASFGSFTGAGGLQDNTITLFGQTFNAGLSKFGADLSMIGSIILFAATFAALGIIMGARD